jgi:hypothetical protein
LARLLLPSLSGATNAKQPTDLYLLPCCSNQCESSLKQQILFSLLLPKEESSFLLLLAEGRKLSSGETNKKEKNHLYLSPSAAEELETVLKQHILFPPLFQNNTSRSPFYGETWTSSLPPASQSPTATIAEIGIDSESESSSLYGSANNTLSSTHTLRDDIDNYVEMSASGTAALGAKNASRPAKGGGGGDPFNNALEARHGDDKSEHVDDLNDALGGHSRQAEARQDKSVLEHVDDFEGKNKPDAWVTVVSKSSKMKERRNQAKKRGREGPPLSLWDRQLAAAIAKKENKRLQGFCTSVYGTNRETGEKDNLSEAEWNRIQYPFQRLYREVIKQIQTYPIKVQVEACLDLSDGKNITISRKRFGLYHNREDGPSRDLSP